MRTESPPGSPDLIQTKQCICILPQYRPDSPYLFGINNFSKERVIYIYHGINFHFFNNLLIVHTLLYLAFIAIDLVFVKGSVVVHLGDQLNQHNSNTSIICNELP